MDSGILGAAPGGEHGGIGTTQLAAATGTPVGQVSAASHPVHVTHTDGSSEDLGVGGQIYANDVVRTDPDGEVEITFVDGTKFSLGGNAEMQIDKLVYDPSGNDNSLALSVVQGAFVFVTGTIAGAPGEGMEVTTPAGSIGVRGTSVGGHYTEGPEGWTVALFKDENGHVGKVVVFNSAGQVVLDEMFESTKLIDFNTPPTTPAILTKDQIEALFGTPLDLMPELQLQNEQRGELDIQTAAGGDGNHGGPNHGSHFYTFGLANFVFGGQGGIIPPTALGDSGPLGGTGLTYTTPGGPQDPDDKQFENGTPLLGLALGGGHIPENSPFGTVAGFVAAILGGPADATYTFSLVDQSGNAALRIFAFDAQDENSPAFEIDPNTGVITVHNPELIDFETTPDFFLTVRATNNAGQSVEVPFQVHLEDVNDNAPVIDAHDPIDLAENSAAGTVVGQVTAHDVDTTGEQTTFSIVEESDPNHFFAIDPHTGQITLTAAGAASGLLDYESEPNSIVLQVVASDGTNTSNPVDVEIDITNVIDPVWSISGDSFVSEGGSATYTVSYSGETLAPGETMTIDFQTQPGSASDGSDFTGVATTLTFTGGGSTSVTVEVSTVGDTVIEGDEDYSVSVGNPSHGNVAGDGQVTTTIGDGDDTILSWQIDGNSTVEEGQNAIYTVSYSGATLADGQIATVTVQSHAGGAEDGKDFGGIDQVLTFTGGDVTSQTISVETFSDTLVESSEDYSVDLISNIGTTGSGVTTEILDPAPPPQWSISGPENVVEGDAAVYTIGYSGGTLAEGEIATVTIDSASGTALEGDDYLGVHTVLTFTGGQTATQTLQIATSDDSVVEGTENYTVSITQVDHGDISAGTAGTEIVDNDTPPDDGRLDGVIHTSNDHATQPVILTFVDENPLTDGDPLHAYSRLLVIGSEASFTNIDADAGFEVDDSRSYRAVIEMPPPADGSTLQVIGTTLEGVDLGPSEPIRIGYDDNDSVHNHPVGLTGVIDPANSSDALQPLQPSTDGTADNDTIFGSKGSFNYLFGADGNDMVEGFTDPEVINGGNHGEGFDSLNGGGGDDIIVYHPDDVINGGDSGFDILRVDDGALELYGNDSLLSSSNIDLTNQSMSNIDMILLTEDANADSLRGTQLELDAWTADRMSRPAGTESGEPTNLYIVGSKGDKLTLDDFGNDWVDGNNEIPGIQPVGHVDDGHGQAFDIYQVSLNVGGRTTNVFVDTDIQVTVQEVDA
jgi:hypothetical protein